MYCCLTFYHTPYDQILVSRVDIQVKNHQIEGVHKYPDHPSQFDDFPLH